MTVGDRAFTTEGILTQESRKNNSVYNKYMKTAVHILLWQVAMCVGRKACISLTCQLKQRFFKAVQVLSHTEWYIDIWSIDS